jgi:endonuclease/exonuclease/phosphatase family metal-dependent hydrolase
MHADTATTTGCVAAEDVTFVSWNIKTLSANLHIKKLDKPGADHWQMRKLNIVNTLRELTPNLIAIQELQSGDGSKHDGGKLAAEEITSALGPNWIQKYCDTQGEKQNERILFMWCGDHVMFRGRSPILSTLVLGLLDSKRAAAADDVQRRFSSLSLTQFITAITDGKICLAADLEREKNKILEGLKTEIGNTAPTTFNFARNPALLTFPANETTGLPPLHVLSFHLDIDPRQNRSEVYVLQSLMCIAWHHGVQLICMGDHNADQAQNSDAWHTPAPNTVAARATAGILPRFEGLSRRVFPYDWTTNRFPYADASKHNDDIFAPKLWNLKGCDTGRVPKEAHDVVDKLACNGDKKAKFAVLDWLWSDHKPLAATFDFAIRPVASGSQASAKVKGLKDALSQAPTPVKTKPVVGGGMRT